MRASPSSELAVARAAKGFMPDDEGLALHDAGLVGGAVGPLLEIGSYCGKSGVYLGAAARRAAPCCSRSTTTTARRRTRPGGSTTTPRSSTPRTGPHGHAAVLPAHDRGRRARGRRRRRARRLADRRPPLDHAARLPVHRRRSRRRRRDGRLRDLVAATCSPAGCSRSTTCSRTRPTGGQAPFHVWQRAVADGFTPISTTGSLRTLRR